MELQTKQKQRHTLYCLKCKLDSETAPKNRKNLIALSHGMDTVRETGWKSVFQEPKTKGPALL